MVSPLVKYKQLNKSIHLVGFSLGCLVATIFATENEEKVLSLTLIAPAAGLNKKDEDFRSKHVSLNLLHKGLCFYANFPFVSALATPLGGLVLRHLSSLLGPTSQQLAALYSTQKNALVQRAMMQYINSFRFLAALWLTQHQIFGEKDKLVPFTVMRRCEELFPHAHVFVARDAGHNVILHAQRAVATRIIDFLNEHFSS
ncbi:hypothetical protein GUITHDRAFT_104632 [Guillardia theta CCMP2712]|uniref:AB hydrolase-1 domain-containing protein n=1 Tax=Guillardia theta (strain CCMP2712) TaxID=905079 RepID=L1JN11_GUITC|nr:hypothetical protein GUITHDRAFT_104632 [Guillardia theta CCMP2712]EKX49669.1 hypothetical protein GUITHDRAFT_104632 [Guillardia theta CCMP2712]|eukprot:XP_005836649.1 hypothetical protein GUITHDRAFT_104632 [Guillardia theta CCMP2712]